MFAPLEISESERSRHLRYYTASGYKEKAARIANAAARTSRTAVARTGGRAGDYEDMTRTELYDRAKRIGIDGRSRMTKPELIKALRNH